MDDGFQQKKNRLDSLSSRLARGNAQARAATREEPKKCKGCSSELAAGATGDSCSSCSTSSSSSGTPSNRRCCPVCGLGVLTVSNFLTCGVCRKWIHADCDRSIEADPDDYSCAACRQSPIVGADAMLGVAADSPLADPDASNQGASALGSLMGSMRSSPVAGSIGGESGRFSQRERRLSGSSESEYSAPNSPSFDPNACSEDDDEFRPGCSRGGGSSRGGRGGKKKPGGRGGTLMKTRSGGKPPSGVFLDRLGKTERGKRGKGRGAGKSGASSGKGNGVAARGGAAARRTSTSGGRGGAVGNPDVTQFLSLLQSSAVNNNPVFAAMLQQQMAVQAAQAAAIRGKPIKGGVVDTPCSSNTIDTGRDEKEDEYVRTVVVVNEDDAFMACAPLCLVCGSIGVRTEQSMVACSGCAHSFHTYCVGLQEKMNSTVKDRGWRCLDCTICEECGKNTDEAKLIMCEECDVAYHMHCLNPPIDRAPPGPWRCQWCAKCRRCNMRVANSGELTKEGLCYPCLSLRKCPKCSKLYQLNENIIRCSQCMKWYHGACEELHTDEMLESAALNKMRCSSCRPNANRGFSSMNDGNITICDNVALNKCADEVLKSKMMPQLFRANSFTESGGTSALAGLLGEFRSGGSIDSHYGSGSMDDDNGPDEDGPGSGLSSLISFGPGSRGGRGGGRGGGAGRGRLLKLGVGGFFVKLPKSKQATAEKDENGAVDPNDPTKKVKVTRKPRRSQLEDFYPSQIQEGFFGIRPVDGKALADVEVAEPVLECWNTPKTMKNPFKMGNTLSERAADSLRTDIEESSMLENMNLNEMMNFDEDFAFDDLFNDDDDDLALTDALDFMKDDTESSQPKPDPDEPGSSMQPQPGQQPMQQHHAMGMPTGFGGMMIKQEPGMMHPHPMMQHPHAMMGPGGMMIKQEPGMMRPESSMSGGSLMAAQIGSANAGERVSASQAATERWEEDEPLADKATKAAVLYVNINFPNQRYDMPEWSDRAKFIHKTWRSLSSDERQIYVQKARHNRAQREKVPRPRGPRNPQLGAPGPSGIPTAGQVAMRMAAAGAGAVPPANYGMQGQMGAVRPPMPPGMPQQPPSIAHLSPDLQQQYENMRKENAALTLREETLAKQLAALRTTKKKLGAKQRQIWKVETGKALQAAQAAAQAAGLPPPTEVPQAGDLNPMEKQTLESATVEAVQKVKELDDAKREAKTQLTEMHQFEMNHRIMSEYVIARQQTSAAAAGNSGPTVGGMLSATMGGRTGMGMALNGPHPFQHMVPPQQVPFSQMMGQERSFQLGGIGGGGAMMGSRMGQMRGWGPSVLRSAMLGSVRHDQIQTPDERDVYECLDDMISKISYDLDGPPPMMQQPQQMGGFPGGGPSLKRMLDGNAMAPPLMGMSAMMQADDGAPKAKKKRQIQKKTTNPREGQDYDTCLGRMKEALAACPPLTRKSIEPVARNESSPFNWPGMSELDRIQEAKASLGHLTLSFAPDVYKNIRNAPVPAEVSMARLMPNVRMSILYQMVGPSSCASPCTPSMVRDDGDTSSPSTSQGVANVSNAAGAASDVIRNLVNGVEKRRKILRCLTKANEGCFPPSDPHRIAFKETKKEEDEEIEVAIEIEERCAPGPSGMGGGEMSSSNSTSSQACREEITKALLQKLQQMLETKKPIEDYQMDTPPQSPSGVEPQMDMKPAPLGFLSHRCRACSCVISGGSIATAYRQSMSLLGLTPSDDGKDDSVTFCTLKCYYMFVANAKVALSPEQLQSAEKHVDELTYSRLKQISADSFARCINQSSMARVKPETTVGAALQAQLGAGGGAAGLMAGGGGPVTAGPPPPTPIGGSGGADTPDVTSPRENKFASLLDEPVPRKENIVTIKVSELAKVDNGRKEKLTAAGQDWKKYDQATLSTFHRIHTAKKELALQPKMGIEFIHPNYDKRTCVLCAQKGDVDAIQGGRLLSFDACKWVHANCVLWSPEVYENASGALMNVHRAINRGLTVGCFVCGQLGATLQCYKVECQKTFHFGCAHRISGRFLKDKTFICPNHSDVNNDVLAPLEALRKLYINRDENQLLTKLFENLDGPRLMLRLGGFTFLRLGQLLPEQLKSCHSSRFIFPLGYSAQRMYWSPFDARRRVNFTLKITEHEGKPLFTVSMPPPRDDTIGAAIQGQPSTSKQIVCSKPSAAEAWKDILENVNKVRLRSGSFLKYPGQTMEGECLFGLGEAVITKMTESLPGVDTLYSYTFRHGGAAVLELPLAENPSGCARCEPRLRTLIKSHRRPVPSGAKSSSSGGAGGGGKRALSLYEELQMQMKTSGYKGDFVQMGKNGRWDGSQDQSYSAYQKMRKEWRNTVYLARSAIQGLGLYAKRDIAMEDMIIEYKGEIVRGEVCEMREKRYFAQNRGTYMFKASDECIIDATMKGGPARYINHSCDPNCKTQIMHLGPNGEDKKIIILAARPIKANEELTYDYQFDVEDDSEKVACLCGAPNCQRWMN